MPNQPKQPQLASLLAESPVIAAVKDDDGLAKSLGCGAAVVFVLYGSVTTVPAIAAQIQAAGKLCILHLDLIDGLAPREAAVDYISTATAAHGIISTKTPLVKYAKEKNLLAVRRFFLLDSIALQSARRYMQTGTADCIEVLPGVMPKIVAGLAAQSPVPIIAGGMMSDKEDVVAALSAGAMAVSTTNPDLWNI